MAGATPRAVIRTDGLTKVFGRTTALCDLDLSRPARALSKGNRQKLAILLALMSGPQVLVLDEPTSGLDPINQQEFQALLREHTAAGGSVLLSSHVLGEVERIADRIGVLRAGRLVAVERIDELRAKSLHHVTARFGERVSAAEFAGLPGVRDLVVDGDALRCSAPQTALDGLLRQITRHPVIDLGCAEAELEETFLTYYGSGNGTGDGTGTGDGAAEPEPASGGRRAA